MATARVTLPLYNLGRGSSDTLAIERAIAGTAGVAQVYINPLTEMVYVVYDPALLDPEHLRAGLDRLGYGAPHPAPQYELRKEQIRMIEQPTQRSRRWPTWTIPLVIIAILAGAALWIWNTATPTPHANTAPAAAMSDGATQTNEGGQVTIAATWPGSSAGPVFSVAMNTHTVDLGAFDLKQLAVLRLDGGREVQPTSWDGPKGGHHSSGTLTFPATASDGTPLIAPNTRTIELIIRDVAGVPERIFRWTPKQ